MRKFFVLLVVFVLSISMMSGSGESAVQKSSQEAKIAEMVAGMTLEQKVGQMFLPITFKTYSEKYQFDAQKLAMDIQQHQVGGIVIFKDDMRANETTWLTREEVRANIQSYQAVSRIPMIIAIDEEGQYKAGGVNIIRASVNPNLTDGLDTYSWMKRDDLMKGGSSIPWMSAQRLVEQYGKTRPNILYDDAKAKGKWLKELGVNVNFAPVADISGTSGYIYSRTMGTPRGSLSEGDTGDLLEKNNDLYARYTSKYVQQIVEGLRDAGVGSSLKHWPGYGGTGENTHNGFAINTLPLKTLEARDMVPFFEGIRAADGTTSVMVTHNIIEVMDSENPASLSPKVHQYLRDRGYEGVIMTDALFMKAIIKACGSQEDDLSVAVVRAVQAGNDMIMGSDFTTEIPCVVEAVRDGRISEGQIDESVKRILRWKHRLGLIECNERSLALMEVEELQRQYMQMAIEEAREGIRNKDGGPFGSVVVKDGKVVAKGHNMVLRNNDSTAHGEITAIRKAEQELGTFDLSGCELYTTGEPCTMCLAACLWANIERVYYGCTIEDNAMIGFRDERFDKIFGGKKAREALGDYLVGMEREACLELFREYVELGKVQY